METAILFDIHSEVNLNWHCGWLKFTDVSHLTIPKNSDSTLIGLTHMDKYTTGKPILHAQRMNSNIYVNNEIYILTNFC